MLVPLKSGTAQGEGMAERGELALLPHYLCRIKEKTVFQKFLSYIHGREKRRYNCSWKDAIIIVIVKAIK